MLCNARMAICSIRAADGNKNGKRKKEKTDI